MFRTDNTDGFTPADLELLNAATAKLVADYGMDESNAADIVNNNWQPAGNTIESLTRVAA